MRKRIVLFIFFLYLVPCPVLYAQSAATLAIPEVTVPPDSLLIVPILVSTDSAIGLAQFVVEYDSSVLSFRNVKIGSDVPGFSVSLTNPDLPFAPSAGGTNANVLIQISGGGVSTFSGQDVEVALLYFEAGPSPGNSPLAFDRHPRHTFLTTYRLRDLAGALLQFRDGAVWVQKAPAASLAFPEILHATAWTDISVPVTVSTDSSIAEVQIIAEYDSSVLRFITARPGTDAQNFSISAINLQLPFAPAHPSANRNVLLRITASGGEGLSGHGLQILELDFEVRGRPGDSSVLAFDPGRDRTYLSTVHQNKITSPNLGLQPGAIYVIGGYIVTNTADSGKGSFRQALIMANLHPGPDTVRFQIPRSDPGFDQVTGTWIIQAANPLPTISDESLFIDGGSQKAFIGDDTNPVGPEIVIRGDGSWSGSGLVVQARGVEIRSLIINRFGYAGIFFDGAEGAIVDDCFIGTNATATDSVPNACGIYLANGSKYVLIGDSLGSGNLISGNRVAGIILEAASENVIAGNTLGMGKTADTRIGNGRYGILILQNANFNRIQKNQIGFSDYGLYLDRASFNHIWENEIGTDRQWEANFGNRIAGICLQNGSSNNRIRKNVIGFNGKNGVYISGPATIGNHLTENRISRHTGPGILAANGGNMEIPPPTITEILAQQIRGHTGRHWEVEIYADDDDEGRVFIGRSVADSLGNFVVTLTAPLPPLPYLTATATDQQGNTSAFSSPVTVTDVERTRESGLPQRYVLRQNFPNPFNPQTEIRFAVPERCFVEIEVRDLLGRTVRTLLNRTLPAGNHSIPWDGRDTRGKKVPAGVYFIHMKTAKFSAVRKAILLN